MQELEDQSYIKNIRAATGAERAGGYVETIGCLRALQEAMAGLYFMPTAADEPEIVLAD
jgi:CDK-activating kinase assembly factor MAT1